MLPKGWGGLKRGAGMGGHGEFGLMLRGNGR